MVNQELIEALWESDAASALTNQAAREIEKMADTNAKLVEALRDLENRAARSDLGHTSECVDARTLLSEIQAER